MSFRKRNIGISTTAQRDSGHQEARSLKSDINPPVPGIRPSPIDGRPTTSTGTPSLDALLAGHSGLALGNSLLIEESGTTDYAGTLLRYYAAEGVVQGQAVLVVGVGEQWGKELPGVVEDANEKEGKAATGDHEKMKIAWRYERLGEFGADREGSRVTLLQKISATETPGPAEMSIPRPFCHSFDLTKRLVLPSSTAITFLSLQHSPSESPFTNIIPALSSFLMASEVSCRLIIPTLLSAIFHPSHASNPHHLLQFLHSLRALLRLHPTRLTAMLSLPLSLYPRSQGLTRWIELLSDGVIELVPFPHSVDLGPSSSTSGAATAQEEKPQGMVRLHKLPVVQERGGGGSAAALGDDLAFTVTRKRFMIKPFSLPPVDGDEDAKSGGLEGKQSKIDVDF